MRLRHVALVYSSKQNADRFLVDVLGLAKSQGKILAREQTHAIFSLDRELRMVLYTSEGLQVEVFIDASHQGKIERIEHICLEVEDLPAFLARCEGAGMGVRRVPRGGRLVTFVQDADGNLFEIKG